MKITVARDFETVPGELAQRLAHQPRLQAHVLVAHLALDLGAAARAPPPSRPRPGRSRPSARSIVGDLERLLAGVGLRDQQVLDLHAELARVADVERVLGVDERRRRRRGAGISATACSDSVGLARGLRPVDLDDAAARLACRCRARDRGSRAPVENAIDLAIDAVRRHREDRSLAELLLDRGDRVRDRLLPAVGRWRPGAVPRGLTAVFLRLGSIQIFDAFHVSSRFCGGCVQGEAGRARAACSGRRSARDRCGTGRFDASQSIAVRCDGCGHVARRDAARRCARARAERQVRPERARLGREARPRTTPRSTALASAASGLRREPERAPRARPARRREQRERRRAPAPERRDAARRDAAPRARRSRDARRIDRLRGSAGVTCSVPRAPSARRAPLRGARARSTIRAAAPRAPRRSISSAQNNRRSVAASSASASLGAAHRSARCAAASDPRARKPSSAAPDPVERDLRGELAVARARSRGTRS